MAHQEKKTEKIAYVFFRNCPEVVNPSSAFQKRLEGRGEGKCTSWLNSDSANLQAMCVCCQAKQTFRNRFTDDDEKIGINMR